MCSRLLTFYFFSQAVISRGEFGALGPNDNCWPQMAGMVPTANEKIKDVFMLLSFSFFNSCLCIQSMVLLKPYVATVKWKEFLQIPFYGGPFSFL